MADSKCKWKLKFPDTWEIFFNGQMTIEDCSLEPLPEARNIDSSYIHRPGDIDYSELDVLPNINKAQILYLVATGHDSGDQNPILAKIASYILVDRLSMPGFIPDELCPMRGGSNPLLG